MITGTPKEEVAAHAWRYLNAMCKRERERLSELGSNPMGRMMQLMGAYDSLNEIECLIPHEYHDD